MDNHLLYCMLCNYRDLYIQDRNKMGSDEKYIRQVVENDINPWIEHFFYAWETEEEERQEAHIKAALKKKLEAAIAEGKEDRS